MHELHLMAQVVKMVEDAIRESPSAKPALVKLKISTLSHLFDHEGTTLRSAFTLAARGTVAQDAALEILPVRVSAQCRTCGVRCEMEESLMSCSTCGARAWEVESVPEVVLQEIVVEE